MPAALDLLKRGHAFIHTAFGSVSFTMENIVGSFTGALDKYSGDKSLLKKGGGYEGEYDSTIVAGIDQFSAVEGPLERTLPKKKLTVAGRVLRIDKVAIDAVSVTFILANPNRSE